MKKSVVLCAGLCAALALTGCKSSESAYKKAYLKAQAQHENQQAQEKEYDRIAFHDKIENDITVINFLIYDFRFQPHGGTLYLHPLTHPYSYGLNK